MDGNGEDGNGRRVYDGIGKHGEDEDKVEQSLFLTRHPSRPTPPSAEGKIGFWDKKIKGKVKNKLASLVDTGCFF